MPEGGPGGSAPSGASQEGERAKQEGVLDKLFGKRLLQAGRYIMSHKSWMKTVPTENCDVLMTLSDTTDDHTLLWLLNHIRLGIPELIIQIRHHKHTRVYAFFVTATYESLLRGADEIGLRKPVKAEFGGGMRSFSCEEDYIYENIENELYFFTSQERQNIIRYWLENLRAKQGEMLHNVHFLEGQPIIPELAARGILQQVFPIHEQRILNRLMKSWVQAICEPQPLDEICDYFGVKIAMYFAWLGFYTSAMVYPAVFGLLLYTFTENDQTSRDICCVVFAIFNVIWSTLFLEEWKRRGAEFAYKWGTLDTPAESIEEPRPQFRGVKRVSPVTNAEEFYYPPWKRLVFQCLVSLPICIICLSFVFLAMLGCFELQEFVLSIKELPRIVRFLPKIVLAVIVTACDEVYKKIAYWLNDMENYRLQSAYEKHLIIKMVLFQFVNSYLSLFYIGFYLKDMERLKEMLATLLITRQFLQNVKEVSQPHLYSKFKRGDLSLHNLREVAHTLFRLLTQKYGVPKPHGPEPRTSARQGEPLAGHGVEAPEAPEGAAKGEKKCLNGGCGVPEEEEDDEKKDSDSEDESLLDCGLKLKKVSFIEKAERKAGDLSLEEVSFLEEGSPTMVEKGMDPASVFELCKDDEDEGDGGPSESPLKGLLEAKEMAVVMRPQRPRGSWNPVEGEEEEEEEEEENPRRKANRTSWIDPPEENYTTQLAQAEVESCMKKYEDTFQDYLEMLTQFGYVVLFSSAFPLAAMCALINNIIEIRSDAFKLCTGLQRPFGQRVESIGEWQKVMEAMGVLAIVVNCYLIGQCGQLQRLFPWLSPEGAIISVVVLEHFALLIKYIIQVAIPDIPGWVAEEMAKLEYQRREAFKKEMTQPKKALTQSQLQLTFQRRDSMEDNIKTTDPNMLILDEIRRIRQEIKDLRMEMKEDIKEANQEVRGEIKEVRSEIKDVRNEIRKDLKKELDILGKRIDKISSDVSKTQKDLDTYKEKTLELERSNSDLTQKQEQIFWKELNQDLRYREKIIKIRGVSEKSGEDLYDRIIPFLADFLAFPRDKMDCEIDKIYRIQSSQAKDRNLPRDIAVCCVKTRVRDLIIQNSYSNNLIIEGIETKIFKDIPPSIMVSRQKYRPLVNMLKYLKIEFRWERIEGLSFMYQQKRYKIDNLTKAKEFEERLRKEHRDKKGDFGVEGYKKKERKPSGIQGTGFKEGVNTGNHPDINKDLERQDSGETSQQNLGEDSTETY